MAPALLRLERPTSNEKGRHFARRILGRNKAFIDKSILTRNATEKFNYTLSFSNSSASAVLFLDSPRGMVRMDFNGSRVDDYRSFQLFAFKQDPDPTIALDNSDESEPRFMWSNGTRIERDSRRGGSKTTTSAVSPTATRPSSAGSLRWHSRGVLYLQLSLTFMFVICPLL